MCYQTSSGLGKDPFIQLAMIFVKSTIHTFLTALIAVLALTGPAQPGELKRIDHQDNSGRATSDSSDNAALTKLTRALYKWHETKSSKDDFNPKTSKSQDSSYVGLDWNAHSKRLKELEKTNFFSPEFLANYTRIAKKIDSDLKDGKMQWLVGDLPPFGNDTNPWCNCQDSPANYWNFMTISNSKSLKNSTTFKWTWNRKTFYKASAIKRDGSWKISYLQGFDYGNFINK